MTLEEIKAAVDAGKKVYWSSPAYKVVKDSKGQYLIACEANHSYIGLTWRDGVTLNGKPSEFFIGI